MPMINDNIFEILNETNNICLVDNNTVCDDIPQVDEAYIPQTNGEGNFVSLYSEADAVNRIEFDSPRWKHQDQLPLIKPLGLNCLLLNQALQNQIQTITPLIPSYQFRLNEIEDNEMESSNINSKENDIQNDLHSLTIMLSHTLGSSLSLSLNELATEIGFTLGDSKRYKIVGAFNYLGASQITSQEYLDANLGFLYQCNGFITRIVKNIATSNVPSLTPTPNDDLSSKKDRLGNNKINSNSSSGDMYNLHLIGDPKLLLQNCTHLWNGKQTIPITDSYRTEIMNRIIRKWSTEGYCISLMCYTFVTHYFSHTVENYNPIIVPRDENYFTLDSDSDDSDDDKDNFRPNQNKNLPESEEEETKEEEERRLLRQSPSTLTPFPIGSTKSFHLPITPTVIDDGYIKCGKSFGNSSLSKSQSDSVLKGREDEWNDIPITNPKYMVLLGLTATQERPKPEFQKFFDKLYDGGVRLVYFSKTDHVTTKNLLQKMGINTDWNCYITLKDRGLHYDNKQLDNWYENAKLPFGIKEIKNHIESVDQVPLKVHCFIRSHPHRIKEMIDIMIENGLTICTMGSCYLSSNLDFFNQSDISISINRDFDKYKHCSHVLPPLKEISVTESIISYNTSLKLSHNTQLTSIIPLLTMSRSSVKSCTNSLLYFMTISMMNIIMYLIMSMTTIPYNFIGSSVIIVSIVTSVLMSVSVFLNNNNSLECYSILPEKNLERLHMSLFERFKPIASGYFLRSLFSGIVLVLCTIFIFTYNLSDEVKDGWSIFIYNDKGVDEYDISVVNAVIEVEIFYIFYSSILLIIHGFCSMSQYQSIIITKPWKSRIFYICSFITIIIHVIMGILVGVIYNADNKMYVFKMRYPWFVWLIV